MLTTTTNRLGRQAETILSASRGSYEASLPHLDAGGRVRLKLSRFKKADDWDDRQLMAETTRALKDLTFAPAGCEIVLEVARGQMCAGEGISYLREHGLHLGRVTVECEDAETVRRWVAALRGEGSR